MRKCSLGPMVIDSLPEVQKLPPERRLELAAEIIEEATGAVTDEPDPEILAALNERYREYRKNPGIVSPWRDVLARVKGSSER